jgi:hypothetical protein
MMIKQLLQFLGRLVGLYFTPDNHVTPVLRLGRYRRVLQPGFSRIIPLLERTLPPVKTSLYVGNFSFEEVLSRDNIPFKIYTTVLFTFNPDSAIKDAAAQLVRGGSGLLEVIVRDFTNRRLRRLISASDAEALSNDEVIARIEEDLVHDLEEEMSILGLKPIAARHGGVMIKEIIAPENFKRTMLDVKHDEAILEVLRSYPVPELVQLLNQLILANSLKDRSGATALMMGSSDTMHILPLLGQNGG